MIMEQEGVIKTTVVINFSLKNSSLDQLCLSLLTGSPYRKDARGVPFSVSFHFLSHWDSSSRMALLTSGIPSLETFCLNIKPKPVHSTAQMPAPDWCLDPFVPDGVKFWQSASQLLTFLLQVSGLHGRSGTSRDTTALFFQQL